MSEQGWDKATEERLAEVARCMEQPEAQNTQETAADIRAALAEIKQQRERADRLGERLADAQLAILAAQHEDALTTEAVLVQMGATRTQRERADWLAAALRRVSDIATGLAAAGIAGHGSVLNVAAAALAAQPPQDREDAADGDITRRAWESRTDSAGSAAGFKVFAAQPAGK